jgi:hypothetical protein
MRFSSAFLFARAGAAFAGWNVFQGVLNVFAATLPGWLVAGVTGDLLAHLIAPFVLFFCAR